MTKLGALFRFFSQAKEGGVIKKSLLSSGLCAFGVYLSQTEIDDVKEIIQGIAPGPRPTTRPQSPRNQI